MAKSVYVTPEKKELTIPFTVSVLLYMALALLITGAIGFGLGYFLNQLLNGATGDEQLTNNLFITYLIMLIVSGIGILVITIIMSFMTFKKKNVLVPYIIYAVFMGILFSSLVGFLDGSYLLSATFVVSAILFLVMCLFGYIFKGKIGWILGILIGACVVCGILCLVNLFLFPWALGVESAFDASCTIYWIIELVMLGVMLISTFVDMYRIRKIAESGEGSKNVAIYCALNLYTDFIAIFVRVLYIFMLISKKND
ncbi:MAG: Bax inhibitor-1 family protein [Bacilli bacterium]